MFKPHFWQPSGLLRVALIAVTLLALWPTGVLAIAPAASTNQAASSPVEPAVSAASQASVALLQGASATNKVLVDSQDTATLGELAAQGAVKLADYDSFTLWQVQTSLLSRLANRPGLTVRDDLDEISLRNGLLNPAKSVAPALSANLTQQKGTGLQLWLVQFVGPIKTEWIANLRSQGAEIVSYLPNDAYIIWADGATLTQLENAKNSVVQWSGPYHPAYRLHPQLQALLDKGKGSSSEAVNVTVQIYANAPDAKAAVSNLLKLGGQVFRGPEQILNLIDVSLALPANQFVAVANQASVVNIEPWSAPKKLDERQGQIIAGNISTTVTGTVVPSGPGYLAWLASKGFPTTPSAYPVVDVVDDGIDRGTNTPLHPDFYIQGQTSNADRLVVNNNCTSDALANGVGGHGNLNAGIVGAYNDRTTQPYQDSGGYNRGVGISPYSRLAGNKIFNNTGSYDIANCGNTDLGVVQSSYNAGATITSNSWGADNGGGYDSSAQAYDALTRDASPSTTGNQQMLHVFAAGNAGNGAQTVGTPGTAKNVLTVGATENVRDDGVLDGCNFAAAGNADNIASFSSRGPTSDQRIKPDIVAPGTHVQGPASQDPNYDGSGVCGDAGSDPSNKYYPNPLHPPGQTITQTLYTWSTGTSHSTPAVAGSASLVYNYYQRVLKPGQTPSPAMLKALLLNTPRYLNGVDSGDTLPSPKQGWGDVNMGALFDSTNHYCSILDQSQVFTTTGQTYYLSCQVNNPSRPVRVSLVWTDAPGATTGNSFVNDLDLQVSFNGQSYRGNVFNGQYSVTGGASDKRNNVENVFLPAGTTGTFIVAVKAANLAGNGLNTGSLPNQDFALVVYNADTATNPTPLLAYNGSTISDAAGGNNNGVIEPGEAISLKVSLLNNSPITATNITSSIQPLNPAQVTMTNAVSAYPDLAPGVAGNNTTPYGFQVVSTLTCGSIITFTQYVTYTGGVFSTTFGFRTGTTGAGPTGTDYTSTDVPKAIPDNNPTGITSTVTVPNGVNVGKIKVTLNINHTWDGDLKINLISPSGTTILLVNRRGSSGDNFTNTVLDDAAATAIANGAAPFTGSYRPEQQLSTLQGEPAGGKWTLSLADLASSDTGTLNSWSITVYPLLTTCAPATPGPATSLAVSGYPSPVFPGMTGTFTVTAKDSQGNPSIGYRGTVNFSSSDPAASLPAPYTFVQADYGSHIFSATLNTPGTQAITATDTVSPTITGSQTGIVVKNLPATITATSGITQATAINQSFPQPLGATVRDSGNGLVAGVVVTFTAPSSGPSAVFANNSNVYTTTTNASGVASSGTVKANGLVGSYTVTATTSGVITPAIFYLTNAPGNCQAFVVTSNTDDGSALSCGTLSYASSSGYDWRHHYLCLAGNDHYQRDWRATASSTGGGA